MRRLPRSGSPPLHHTLLFEPHVRIVLGLYPVPCVSAKLCKTDPSRTTRTTRVPSVLGHVNSKKKPCWRTPSQHMLEFFIFRVGVVTGHKQASVKNRVGFDSTQHEMLKIPTRFFFRVGGPNTVCHTPSQKIPNLSFLNCHHPFSPKKLC